MPGCTEGSFDLSDHEILVESIHSIVWKSSAVCSFSKVLQKWIVGLIQVKFCQTEAKGLASSLSVGCTLVSITCRNFTLIWCSPGGFHSSFLNSKFCCSFPIFSPHWMKVSHYKSENQKSLLLVMYCSLLKNINSKRAETKWICLMLSMVLRHDTDMTNKWNNKSVSLFLALSLSLKSILYFLCTHSCRQIPFHSTNIY